MLGKIVSFMLGAGAGGVGGFLIGKKFEEISNTYVLEEKERSIDWLVNNADLSYCNNAETKKVFELFGNVAKAKTVDDVLKHGANLKEFLSNVVDAFGDDFEFDETAETDVHLEEKEVTDTDGEHVNQEDGKEVNTSKPEDAETDESKEDKSEETEPAVQTQKPVQVVPEERSDDVKPFEIKELPKLISDTITGSISKELIEKYVSYVASVKGNDLDEFDELIENLSKYIRAKDEENVIKMIYAYAEKYQPTTNSKK